MRINLLYKKQSVFTIAGEKYKRIFNDSIPEDLNEWYQRKNIYFTRRKKIDGRLFSKELVNDLMHDFKLIAPVYNYFIWLKKHCPAPQNLDKNYLTV